MKSNLVGRLHLVALPAAMSAFAFAAPCAARADDGMDAPKKSDLDDAVQSTIFVGDAESKLYDDVQQWKKDNGVPVEVGAWHWWHMNRNAPHDLHYGTPALGGTYYYWAKFDPSTDENGGTRLGLHVDARARDGDESFRPFYKSRVWIYEGYVWAEACGFKVEGGQIARRFGLDGDGDGSFYGTVPYFDGWNLAPDWGASVEHTCRWGDDITAPSWIQAFVAEAKVDSSVDGADLESDDEMRMKLTGVARTVPTWKLSGGDTLALGLSATIGKVDDHVSRDHYVTAGAVDLTYTHGGAKVFGELLDENGARNDNNYVTGGRSDRATDWILGGSYTYGFATLRATMSHGEYKDPGGRQVLYLLGATFALTKNVDFYVEWVRWDMKSQGGARVFADDSFNFALAWRF